MNTCKDCKLYLPVDVFRGLCKLEKKEIFPDDESCSRFDMIPKCGFCAKYSSEKDNLGKCMGIHLAYPDMNASKCDDFEWFRKN
jgi:4-hydroxyphenylacetate decarboxylase small subunit